ncbi:TatD family hydrolase [Thiovibrio frasassiensis]|uniref:TatD family hydrolase n=1 Tax=Thiovibrio frasassiensis TaxID=2984131 RepID=A0A9X4RR33_9BACT|nr:TatD family hydrolase [Thiovibrio frasassiensis]MDG4476902.1 TatD family hydrolase [Thiovibrio frasassiensis]
MEKNIRKKEIALPVLGDGAVLIDTHCHLDMSAYQEDYAPLLLRARDAGVSRIISVGIDLESSRRAIALAEQDDGIYATVGVHPHNVGELSDADYLELVDLCRHPKVVAYGEIGLDYVKNYAPVSLQKEHFARQVALAKELHLPLVVHDREAHEDIMELLEMAGPFPAGGVMHCFSGDAAFARRVLALGFYISIPGVVTFAKAEMLQEAVREIPLSSLVLETDGPFLAPAPYRGKRNEPRLLLFTAQKVAALKNLSLAEVARETTRNGVRLFALEGR